MRVKIRSHAAAAGEDLAPPVIGHFPNGPPPEASLKRGAAVGGMAGGDGHIQLLRRSKRRRINVKLPRGQIRAQEGRAAGFVERDSLVYEGKNFGGADSRSQRRCRYAVGVFDRRTRELRIVPGELFALRPARGPERDAAAVLPAEDEKTQALRGRQKLTQKFGSVRRRQELERYQMNATGEENMAGEAGDDLGGALSRGKVQAAAAASAAAAAFDRNRSFLPAGYDRETTEVSQIYPLSTLIPEPVRGCLRGEASAFMRSPPTKGKSAAGSFVLHALEAVGGGGGEAAEGLYFLHQLLRLQGLTGFRKREEVEKIFARVPEACLDHLLREYTSGEERLSTSVGGVGDKIIAHVLILALHLTPTPFTLEPSRLAVDMQIAPTKLVLYLREIGCKVQTKVLSKAKAAAAAEAAGAGPAPAGGKIYRAVLQAPLKFPEPPKKRGNGPPGA
jgi:hypothetical protein